MSKTYIIPLGLEYIVAAGATACNEVDSIYETWAWSFWNAIWTSDACKLRSTWHEDIEYNGQVYAAHLNG